MPSPKPLDKEQLIELHYYQKLSPDKIGEAIGCSGRHVRSEMKRLDITAIDWNKTRAHITEEELKWLYIIRDMGIDEISRLTGIGRSSLYRKLDEYKIPIRTPAECRAKRKPDTEEVIEAARKRMLGNVYSVGRKQSREEILRRSEARKNSDNRLYSKDHLIDILKKIASDLGRAPTVDEWKHMDGVPIIDHYYKYFGGFTKALELIGVEPIGTNMGRQCTANDGHPCRSIPEKIVDDWLYDNNIPHTLEPHYPEGRFRADWEVDGSFIEFFGLTHMKSYKLKMERKKIIAKENNIKVIALFYSDLTHLDDKLGRFKRGG